MKYLLLTTLSLLLSACGTYDFVPTPVPELISKVTYTTTDASGQNTWEINNDTLGVRYKKISSSGRLISQSEKKLTPNDFNIIATGLEKAEFKTATSKEGKGSSSVKEKLIVQTYDDSRVFTQDDKTKFPEEIDAVTKTIPRLVQ